ncbi:MAG: sigma-70 family RNA polymerase sigma factor [Nitrospirae bacterium]|nr:sigma-70 family RNA polymerase sigma factor [Nitrospirota bacterium]
MEIFFLVAVTFLPLISLIVNSVADTDGDGSKNKNAESFEEDARLVEKRDFETLFKKHDRGIYWKCFKILGNREDAEDATQEAFLKSIKNIEQLKEARTYRRWLGVIASNICNNIIGKRKPIDHPENEDNETEEAIMNEHSTPEDEFIKKELEKAVRRAIASIKDNVDRKIVILRHYNGLRMKEIAEEVGKTRNATQLRYCRTLEELYPLLEHLKGGR